MSSRAILGFASISGLLVSMALPAFAQTTTPPTPNTPSTTTTTTNCPPAGTGTPGTTTTTTTTTNATTSNPNAPASTSAGNTTPNGNTTSGTGPGVAAQPKTATTTCPNAAPMPQTAPMSTPNYDALTNNPNGPDWLAKFNRPNVSNNYLGTTTRPHSMRMRMTTRCHYVMQHGVKTKVCK